MKRLNKLILIGVLLMSQNLMAENVPDDSDALKGVTIGRVIFDINMIEAKKMTLYLNNYLKILKT